jgi:hypothetical protein
VIAHFLLKRLGRALQRNKGGRTLDMKIKPYIAPAAFQALFLFAIDY